MAKKTKSKRILLKPPWPPDSFTRVELRKALIKVEAERPGRKAAKELNGGK